MQTHRLSYPFIDSYGIPQKIPDRSFLKACFTLKSTWKNSRLLI